MRLSLAALLTVCSSMAVNQVHAGVVNGMSEMINEAFTFREDQKERVAPKRTLPPKTVLIPNFNATDNASWARTYTRQDLSPVDYMAGSASKVMRPDPRKTRTSPSNRLAMLEHRARANAAANTSGRVYIGQPGTGPGMRLYDANLGKKTAVGNPRESWKQGQRSQFAQARPGDYNYNAFPSEHVHGNMNHQHTKHDGTRHRTVDNIRFHDNGVNTYAVNRGDTLTTISEQPQVYGNWKLWPLIQEANRAAIGQNPNMIYPNTQLDIPRDLSDDQVRRAVRQRANW